MTILILCIIQYEKWSPNEKREEEKNQGVLRCVEMWCYSVDVYRMACWQGCGKIVSIGGCYWIHSFAFFSSSPVLSFSALLSLDPRHPVSPFSQISFSLSLSTIDNDMILPLNSDRSTIRSFTFHVLPHSNLKSSTPLLRLSHQQHTLIEVDSSKPHTIH